MTICAKAAKYSWTGAEQNCAHHTFWWFFGIWNLDLSWMWQPSIPPWQCSLLCGFELQMGSLHGSHLLFSFCSFIYLGDCSPTILSSCQPLGSASSPLLIQTWCLKHIDLVKHVQFEHPLLVFLLFSKLLFVYLHRVNVSSLTTSRIPVSYQQHPRASTCKIEAFH